MSIIGNGEINPIDLQGTDLQGADLSGAHFEAVYLRGSQLESANLFGTNLQTAQLSRTELQGADLRGAQLQEADLRGAQLQGANVDGALLSKANVQNTDLRDIRNLTQEQLEQANGDVTTLLPPDGVITRPEWWRTLPADEALLSSSQEFAIKVCRTPLFFQSSEGWYAALRLPNSLYITSVGITYVGSLVSFNYVPWVCSPEKPHEQTAVLRAPNTMNEMITWYQMHPYLTIEDQKAVEIGGVAGTQIDVVVSPEPNHYLSSCSSPCVPLFLSTHTLSNRIVSGNKNRIIVLKVEGEMINILIEALPSEFEEYSAKVNEILSTVKWGTAAT